VRNPTFGHFFNLIWEWVCVGATDFVGQVDPVDEGPDEKEKEDDVGEQHREPDEADV
jgi:hypothetical protein